MQDVAFEHIGLVNVRLPKCWRSRRYDSADIAKLAESTEAVGLLEPIIVAPTRKPGQYELAAGYRHFLAAKRLGFPTIIAGFLDQPLDESEVRVIAEVESNPSRVGQADLLRLLSD